MRSDTVTVECVIKHDRGNEVRDVLIEKLISLIETDFESSLRMEAIAQLPASKY